MGPVAGPTDAHRPGGFQQSLNLGRARGERLVELLQELFFLLVELFGNPRDDANQLIAASVSVEARDALALQAKDLVGRRPARNPQQHFTIECGHLEPGAERELWIGQLHVDEHVVAVSFEAAVFLFVDDDEQVAAAPSPPRRVASPAHGDVIAPFFNDPTTTEIYPLSLHDALAV